MTTKEALHSLVDEPPEDRAELARFLLEDLRGAADDHGPPLDEESLASVDRGIADIAAGRVKSIDEYEREGGQAYKHS
jgi:Putative addiction module component